MARDYYEILGVNRSATPDEIKKAYRQIAMKYHPDKNPGNKEAEEKFKVAAEAYSVLTDPEKRKMYDQYGEDGLKGSGFGGAQGFSGGAYGFDLSDALRTFMEGFGGFGGFDDFFGGGDRHSRRSSSQSGSDLKIKIPLTLEEINTGVNKKIKIKRLEICEQCGGTGAKPGTSRQTCPVCKGTGEIREISRSIFGQMVNVRPCSNCRGEGTIIEHRCPVCGGEGRIKETKEISIEIPAGVSTGNYKTIHGGGNAGYRKGVNGDLIVIFEEKPHEFFIRNEDDVLIDLWILPSEAVLGAEIEVPTLSGRVNLMIPSGTQPGKLLRLKHKGIPHLNHSGRGDQIVRIQIRVPDNLTEKEKEMYREIGRFEMKKIHKESRYSKIRY